jgi:hypothetical protein
MRNKRWLYFWWLRIHKAHLEKRKLRFIRWYHDIAPTRTCWADCVTWSFNPLRFNPFRIENGGCKQESMVHSTRSCYCGLWVDGKCWAHLSGEERDKLKGKDKAEYGKDELPF